MECIYHGFIIISIVITSLNRIFISYHSYVDLDILIATIANSVVYYLYHVQFNTEIQCPFYYLYNGNEQYYINITSKILSGVKSSQIFFFLSIMNIIFGYSHHFLNIIIYNHPSPSLSSQLIPSCLL